jgi:hypothetical protein
MKVYENNLRKGFVVTIKGNEMHIHQENLYTLAQVTQISDVVYRPLVLKFD